MANKTTRYTGGIGLGSALFILFLTLKLTGIIGWSWWWVTAPLWLPITMAFVVGSLIAFVALLARGFK